MTVIKRQSLFALGLVLSVSLGVFASEEPTADSCPGPVEADTQPSSVDVSSLVDAVRGLETTEKGSALEWNASAERDVRGVFDLDHIKTKMEQFYRLLFVIQKHVKPDLGSGVAFDPTVVRKILTLSGVFTDPSIPNEIVGVTVDRSKKEDPRYTVRFGNESTKVPLNGGKGFNAWERGRCQFNKALIFHREFSFSLRSLKNGNLIARYFRGVDLFGDFGTRGVVDVDLNYVTLKSVEFFKGTNRGEVTAQVSPEEFRKNDHNPLLRIVTKFVGNKSVQPIDW